LLHDLAARVGTSSDEHNYGDNTAVWFESGSRVLDYVRSDHRCNPESFKDSLEEQGVFVGSGTRLLRCLPICRAYRTNGVIRFESTGNWSSISTTADDLA